MTSDRPGKTGSNRTAKGNSRQKKSSWEQREGRNHADEPEAVIAVQVAQEDVSQPVELQPHAAELDLSPLAAINHKQVVANVEHLSARVVSQGRQCRPAAQNIDFKFSHTLLLCPCPMCASRVE